jgi:uncharacterized membrane protein
MALTAVAGKKGLSFNRKKLMITSIIFGSILMAPLIIDGLGQAMFSYESTNQIRLITGIGFGIGFVACLGAYLESFIYRSMFLREF